MKVEDAIKVLTDFNKWRRGEPPYEWNEDPSLMIEFPFDVKEVGEAIDEAIRMLKHADDMERKSMYEYADGNTVDGYRILRRKVGEWEEVPNV